MTTDTKDEGVLQYFPGGRKGVLGRFGDAFRKNLEKLSDSELHELGEYCEVGYDVLRKILNRHYEAINSEVAETLYNSFSIPVNKILGEPNIPEDEKSRLVQKMHDAKFVSVSAPMSEDNLLQVYVALESLREL